MNKKILLLMIVLCLPFANALIECGDYHVEGVSNVQTSGEEITKVFFSGEDESFMFTSTDYISLPYTEGELDCTTGIFEGETFYDIEICENEVYYGTQFSCNLETNELEIISGVISYEDNLLSGDANKISNNTFSGTFTLDYGVQVAGTASIEEDCILINGELQEGKYTITGEDIYYCFCEEKGEKNVNFCESIDLKGNLNFLDDEFVYALQEGEISIKEDYTKIDGTSTIDNKLSFKNNEIYLISNLFVDEGIYQTENYKITSTGSKLEVGSCEESFEGIDALEVLDNKLCFERLKINKIDSGSAEQAVNVLGGLEEDISENTRNMDQYADNLFFVVSDQEEWQTILKSMSLSMWEGDENCNREYGKCIYPFFVAHQEETQVESFYDLDPISLFLSQYYEEELWGIFFTSERRGEDARILSELGLIEETLIHEEYTQFWTEFTTVVVVEDDYESGIIATIYASTINAPLFFENEDYLSFVEDKEVIWIGNNERTNLGDITLTDSLTLDELDSQLNSASDKILVTNPNDMDETFCETLHSPLYLDVNNQAKQLEKAYCGVSILTPLLAFTKDEKVEFIDLEMAPSAGDYTEGVFEDQYNSQLKSSYNTAYSKLRSTISGDYNYLTLLASPKAIPLKSKPLFVANILDNKIAENKKIDSNGRIFGVTLSDTSSYINRVIFFSDDNNILETPVENVFLGAEDMPEIKRYFFPLGVYLSRIGVNFECDTEENFLPKIFPNQCNNIAEQTGFLPSMANSYMEKFDLIFFDGHATVSGWFSFFGYIDMEPQFGEIFYENYDIAEPYLPNTRDLIDVENTFLMGSACNLLNYNTINYQYKEDVPSSPYLYGTWFLRKGGIGIIGGADSARVSDGSTLVSGYGEDFMLNIMRDPNIGKVIPKSSQEDPYCLSDGCSSCRTIDPGSEYEPFVLFGDPTINLNINKLEENYDLSYYKGGLAEIARDPESGKYVQEKFIYSGYNTNIYVYINPKGESISNTATINVYDLFGANPQEFSGSCSRTNYCEINSLNEQNPYQCTFEVNLQTGVYKCDVDINGHNLPCPFAMVVSENMKISNTVIGEEFYEIYPGALGDLPATNYDNNEIYVGIVAFHAGGGSKIKSMTTLINGEEILFDRDNECLRNPNNEFQLVCLGYVPFQENENEITFIVEDEAGSTIEQTETFVINPYKVEFISPEIDLESNLAVCADLKKEFTVSIKGLNPLQEVIIPQFEISHGTIFTSEINCELISEYEEQCMVPFLMSSNQELVKINVNIDGIIYNPFWDIKTISSESSANYQPIVRENNLIFDIELTDCSDGTIDQEEVSIEISSAEDYYEGEIILKEEQTGDSLDFYGVFRDLEEGDYIVTLYLRDEVILEFDHYFLAVTG
jgi:hypothetical protein